MTQQTGGQEQEPQKSADVGSRRVAMIYAEALLNAAQKHGQAAEVLAELQGLVDEVFQKEPQFESFLATGAIGRDRKAQVIQTALLGRASEIFTNFCMVLNDHDRLELLRPILAAARELHEQRSGQIRVTVWSAVALPDDQQDRLRNQLRTTLKREPLVETRVDPELLGGMVVRVDDWLYDASVRNQLETIRTQLIARSSHEIQSRRDRFSSTNGN